MGKQGENTEIGHFAPFHLTPSSALFSTHVSVSCRSSDTVSCTGMAQVANIVMGYATDDVYWFYHVLG